MIYLAGMGYNRIKKCHDCARLVSCFHRNVLGHSAVIGDHFQVKTETEYHRVSVGPRWFKSEQRILLVTLGGYVAGAEVKMRSRLGGGNFHTWSTTSRKGNSFEPEVTYEHFVHYSRLQLCRITELGTPL